MHKTKHKERTLQAGKSERGKNRKKSAKKKKHETSGLEVEKKILYKNILHYYNHKISFIVR